MQRRAMATAPFITLVLILQIIPLLLFPASSFSPKTQEWWLPVLLTIMVIIADVYLVGLRTTARWPWDLLSFAQGFNIISRLMMLFPHSTTVVNKANIVNVTYIVLTLASMALSVWVLWFSERPDVRVGLLRRS